MCSGCKSIVTIEEPKRYWMKRKENPIGYDAIVEKHEISHGFCKPCVIEYYGEELADLVKD